MGFRTTALVKETLPQIFFCEFCKIFEHIFWTAEQNKELLLTEKERWVELEPEHHWACAEVFCRVCRYPLSALYSKVRQTFSEIYKVN